MSNIDNDTDGQSQAWLQKLLLQLLSGVLFLTVIVPLGLVGRLLGVDFLRLKRKPGASTYWIARSGAKSMRKRY